MPTRTLLSVLACLLLLLASSLHAGERMPTYYASTQNSVTIGEGILMLEDPDGTLSLKQLRRPDTPWQINPHRVFNIGYAYSAWWLAFEIRNDTLNTEWLLELTYPPLDFAEFHILYESGKTVTYEMGDKLPFYTRPVEHRFFIAPLDLAPGEGAQIYLRVKTSGSLQAPLILWSKKEFQHREIRVSAVHGLYYGGLLIIALYNLLIYLVLRERSYLYYVGWVASMFWFMASLNGWAYQFFWPQATQWNDQSIITSLAMVILFGYLFSSQFLGIHTWSLFFRLLKNAGIVFSIVLFFATFWLPYDTMMRLILPMAIVSCVFGLIAGLIAVRKRVASAQIYLISWSMLLMGGVIVAFNKVGSLPRTLFTDYVVQLGSLLDVLLLSFAMAERINQERQLRMEAQNNALDLQRQINEELEQRVHERTQALEDANRKLRDLSDTDQLTGLKNRRFLTRFLEMEFARAQRSQHPIALLMIDVDHFKSINDNYGHPQGDDCLQEIAQRIQQEMLRPSDTAARYGGEEFCVVLPETSIEGALSVAERIRHKVEATPIPTRSQALSLTVSVGVHVTVPQQTTHLETLISHADAALYEAKQRGRNQVISSQDLPVIPTSAPL